MKTAVISGSSRGIGAEIAKTFSKSGYRVVINYKNSEESAFKLVSDLNGNNQSAIAVKADVSTESGANELFETSIKMYGTIDVLVNNAGISLIKPLIDCSSEDFCSVINNNFKSVFLLTKLFGKHMMYNHSGSIINVSSIWGECGGSCESLYSASKAAIIGFTKACAKEFAAANVTCNAVSPGLINTEMNSCLSENEMSSLLSEIPLNRLGSSKEVSDAVLFLAENRYITGEVLRINGGWLI